jgi:uncharacterized protein YlxW (UPF0749 family)
LSTADTALLVAIAACVAAGVLLLAVVYLAAQLRRIRRGQRLLLGADQRDLVEYAVGLLARVEHVETRTDDVDAGVRAIGARLDGTFHRLSLLRYDALEGSGGRQSVSLALLDASSNGVVITAIQDRDYARIYVKQLVGGESDVELSPEERQAVDSAAAQS